MQVDKPDFVTTSTNPSSSKRTVSWTSEFRNIINEYSDSPDATFSFFVDCSGSMLPYREDIFAELNKLKNNRVKAYTYDFGGFKEGDRQGGGSQPFEEVLFNINRDYDSDINVIVTDGEVLIDDSKIKAELMDMKDQNRFVYVITSDKRLYKSLIQMISTVYLVDPAYVK